MVDANPSEKCEKRWASCETRSGLGGASGSPAGAGAGAGAGAPSVASGGGGGVARGCAPPLASYAYDTGFETVLL